MIPSNLKFTEQHEWVSIEDNVATIGITDYATEELGEIVFVELPERGDNFSQGDEFGTVESVKSLSSLYLPLSGEVQSSNTEVINEPSLLNDSAYEDGWLVKLTDLDIDELDNLMSAEEYQTYLDTL